MRIERYGNTRYWAVREKNGSLICLCVYRKGAQEVVRRLRRQEPRIKEHSQGRNSVSC